MAVLSNIRADFPGFALILVEHSRFLPAARALFQERKSVSVEQIRSYLKDVAQVHLPEAEVETILGQLLSGQGENLPAVALHQAFLFKKAARGFWRGQYSFIVVQQVYGISSQYDQAEGRDIYLLFGLAEDEESAEKLLYVVPSPEAVLQRLEQYGIAIDGWFPLSAAQCRLLLSHTKDMKEVVAKFGAALLTADGLQKAPFVSVC